MINVDYCAEATSGKLLPEDVLRITPSHPVKNKTCLVEDFPVEGYSKYYISSIYPLEKFLSKFPTLDVDCIVTIAPSLVKGNHVLKKTLYKYHPEALL